MDCPATGDIARLVQERLPTILDRYEAELHSTDNALTKDDEVLAHCLAYSRRILDDVVLSLDRGEFARSGDVEPTEYVGCSCAFNEVPITESLNAVSLLFDIAAVELHELFRTDSSPRNPLLVATRALHRSLSDRVSALSTSYNRYLSNRLHDEIIEERRYLARELHDRVGAAASTASRNLELFDIYRVSDPTRAEQRVSTAQDALRSTIAEIHQLTTGLRSTVPHVGLEDALLGYARSSTDEDVKVVVVVNGDERWASENIRSELHLICREALRNALEHGRPTMVVVRADITPDEVRAVVEDDGSGFDPARSANTGSGVELMRERAGLAGGTATVMSRPGHGTRVELVIPAR